MALLYQIVLFGAFICISNFVCDFSEIRKTANVKATAVSVGTILFIMIISRIIYFFGEPLLKSTAGIIISYFIDYVIPIGLTVFAIYYVSKIFRYQLTFPKWMLIVSIASALVLCPLHLIYTKTILSYMDMLTSENGITPYSAGVFFSSTKYYGLLVSLIAEIPAIVLAAFLIIKRIAMNRSRCIADGIDKEQVIQEKRKL